MMDAWVDRIFGALSQAFDRDSAFTPILTAAQELDFEHCAYGMRLALPVSHRRIQQRLLSLTHLFLHQPNWPGVEGPRPD